MVKGIPLELGGTTYVVPPLSLGSLEALQERLEAFEGKFDKVGVALVIDCLLAALKRNYPEMTRETVANDLLGLENALEVMNAIADVSGLLRKSKEAEAESSGEARAPSTGQDSSLS